MATEGQIWDKTAGDAKEVTDEGQGKLAVTETGERSWDQSCGGRRVDQGQPLAGPVAITRTGALTLKSSPTLIHEYPGVLMDLSCSSQ